MPLAHNAAPAASRRHTTLWVGGPFAEFTGTPSHAADLVKEPQGAGRQGLAPPLLAATSQGYHCLALGGGLWQAEHVVHPRGWLTTTG